MDENCGKQYVEKPKIEIPDATFKFPGNGNASSSPRSIQGFPLSPQSPEVLPLVGNLQPAQTVQCTERGRIRICVGEYVLVRCNQSKWLLGQVRRFSKTGLRIWVGVAQTLVEVPFELLGSHLLKLNSPSSSSSSSSIDSLEVGPSGQVLAPFHCVRPAHLSHRKLYQPLGMLSKDEMKAAPPVPNTITRKNKQLLRSSSLPTSFRGDNNGGNSGGSIAETEIIPAFIRNKAIAAELPSMVKRPILPQQPKANSIGPSSLGTKNYKSDSSEVAQPFSDSDNARAWVTVIEKGTKKQMIKQGKLYVIGVLNFCIIQIFAWKRRRDFSCSHA